MGQRKKLKQMKHISYSMCKWSVQKKGSENNQWQEMKMLQWFISLSSWNLF